MRPIATDIANFEEVRRDLATLMTGAAANQDMKWIAL